MNHKMKRGAAVLLGAGLCMALLAGCSGQGSSGGTDKPEAGAKPGKLVIASWGGNTAKATRTLAAEFTKDTGIEVEVLETGNHLSMIRAMNDAKKTEWDLLDGGVLGDVFQLDQDGLIERWDAETLAKLSEAYGAENIDAYSYPWIGYGQVVVCNADAVAKCPTTIKDLFDTKNFPGNRMLAGDPGFFNTMLPPLALVAGEPRAKLFGSNDVLDKMSKVLRDIAPSTTVWYASGDAQNQAILQGEADMGLMASGRAFTVKKDGVNLQINWEGTNIYGASAILKNAPNKDSAYAYVKWLTENPEAQARWAETLNYAVPHLKAIDFINPDVAKTLANYPANAKGLLNQDVAWQAANKTKVDETFLNIIAGS